MINILAYSTEASLSKDTENMLQAEWGFTQDLTDCDKIIKHRGIIDALYESENPALTAPQFTFQVVICYCGTAFLLPYNSLI